MLMLLNKAPDTPITEDVVHAWLSAPPSCEVSSKTDSMARPEDFFERNGNVKITEAMLKAAKRPADMRFLLERAPKTLLTREVLQAVATKVSEPEKMASTLSNLVKAIGMPQFLFNKYLPCQIVDTAQVLAFLKRDPDLKVKADVLESLIRSSPKNQLSRCTLEALAEVLQKI